MMHLAKAINSGVLPKSLVKLRHELIETQAKKAAWSIIEEYFSFFDLDSIHNELWILTAGTLTNDEIPQSAKAQGRQDLIFFFEYTKMFVEAIYLLHNKRKKNAAVNKKAARLQP